MQMSRDGDPVFLQLLPLSDIVLTTDGAYFDRHDPPYIVSMAVCECPSPSLRANWYYKFSIEEACDQGFWKGSALAEIGAMHAATCLLYEFRTDIRRGVIIFNCMEAFRCVLLHSEMVTKSGRWDDVERDAVVYQLYDLILGVLDWGGRVVLRHKRTFPQWDNDDKESYPAHVECQKGMLDSTVSEVCPHVLPLPKKLPFHFPALSAFHREVHFKRWQRVQFERIDIGCRLDLPHYELTLS